MYLQCCHLDANPEQVISVSNGSALSLPGDWHFKRDTYQIMLVGKQTHQRGISGFKKVQAE